MEEIYLFFLFILNGILIGLLFDFFRILRKTFKTNNIITYMQDIVFWVITGILILYTVFTFNNGDLRLYVFLGIFLGCIIYLIILSKYFIKINVSILLKIKKSIKFIFNFIFKPFKILKYSIYSLLTKLRHFFTKITKKHVNNFKKIKN